jgi:hypothetical protein
MSDGQPDGVTRMSLAAISPPRRQSRKYRRLWLDFFAEDSTAHERLRRNLGGKDLVCWCKLSAPCHADVLLDLANHNSR